jgi:NAD(P)-dependent dehydrogenase (short-subunit alcohol dehydrogenase family)
MNDLYEKVAVITGGASGIGKGMAERFARAGMKLALVDIEAAPLEATAEALRATGADVMTQIVDVSDADAMDALADAVLDRFGHVHVICNNAGVAAGGPMWELTTKDWEFTMGPNIWGVVHGVRVFAKHLIAQNEGHFVNTASMAGLVSTPGMGAYNVTKQGVVALSETLYLDLQTAGSDVGVSVLCPGFVRTQIWNSGRNRPAHLSNEDAPEHDEALSNFQNTIKTVIDNSMPTEEVANQVHDAILAKRLYILTHEATKPALEERVKHILNDENPKLLPVSPERLSK